MVNFHASKAGHLPSSLAHLGFNQYDFIAGPKLNVSLSPTSSSFFDFIALLDSVGIVGNTSIILGMYREMEIRIRIFLIPLGRFQWISFYE